MSEREAARRLLNDLTGDPAADFRDGQWEAIERLVVDRGRVLVVQRTGWGKSAVYFLATRLLRDAGAGPTVLVSPLLALMRNQIDMAERLGVSAATINSSNVEAWNDIEDRIRAGSIDILLISPERLNNQGFRADVLPHLVRSVGLLVVDEAHCISDWGHDFRPDYRRISSVLQALPSSVPVLCTTATANDRVIADVVDQLGDDLEVTRGRLDRESLELAVVALRGQPQRLAWLGQVIPELPGSGIVYCLTVDDTERVASWLRSCGIDAMAYSGRSDNDERLDVEDALLHNRVKVVVATSALGMGFDKPDLPFVIHFQSPGSPIAYYQQVGRAGRGVDRAVGVLLSGMEDREIQDYFIRTAFPEQEQAEQVVDLLAAAGGAVSLGEILNEVNVKRTRLDAMLKVLEVEGAVERAGSRWQRTPRPWAYDRERVERVTRHRRQEQQSMVDYVTVEGCRMRFLREQLDDPVTADCGRCDNCTGQSWDRVLDDELFREAIAHLRSSALEIRPRKRWPAGLPEVSGSIPPDRQLAPGRALCVHNDGGWGQAVRAGKCDDGGYSDDLVQAAADLVRKWQPSPPPEWVTAVPTRRNTPDLVLDFAQRVAAALAIPYVSAVERIASRRPQNEMQNSAQQANNVLGAFTIRDPVSRGPVLLIDDVVDSRWTLTVIACALREAGSGDVFPLALAEAVGA